tara:strand:- start:14545 stop:16497 length:1953 start_codon:yes stop_codon:yes gene_type:complete
MSYSISSSNPIEFFNPNRIWKIGHKGQLREVDVSGILNISGNMHFTNQITGNHLDLYGDISLNNLYVNGNTYLKTPVYQEINIDLSYIEYNGNYGLAKHFQPKQDEQTTKNLIINSKNIYYELTATNTTNIVNSKELRKIMVIGLNGYYASSIDGIYWDISGSISNNKLNDIIWVKEQNKFVIIGDNGYIAISNNSTNIDSNFILQNINTFNSIVWSPQLGIYVIVGINNNSTNFIATSIDAINWSNNITYPSIEKLFSVIWIPELQRFLGVGSYLSNNNINLNGFYMSSTNGINWDISNSIIADFDIIFYSVAWSSELSRIVAVGENGFYATAFFKNGTLNWDYSGNIQSVNKYNKIIWIPDLHRFVAVGKKNPHGHLISSLDGIYWDISIDLPKSASSVSWSEYLGKLLITDNNGRIYYTDPKYVFQTTYNLYENTTLNNVEINNDASLNNNLNVDGITTLNKVEINNDASLNNNLNVSGITTLSNHLLTDSSYVKIPVSYSTFSIVKGNQLLSDLTNIYGVWHNLSTYGYSVTINPLSHNSYIKLDFKINYICSNDNDGTISFRVKNNLDEIIFADLSLGTITGVTNRGIYNGLYIDTTQYNSSITYSLEFLIADNINNNNNTSVGILGHNHGNSNIIIAQELYQPT